MDSYLSEGGQTPIAAAENLNHQDFGQGCIIGEKCIGVGIGLSDSDGIRWDSCGLVRRCCGNFDQEEEWGLK